MSKIQLLLLSLLVDGLVFLLVVAVDCLFFLPVLCCLVVVAVLVVP